MPFRKYLRAATTAIFFAVAAACVFSCDDALSQDVNPGDLVLRYDPSTGNLTYHYLGTGASTLDIYLLDIITLGDGTVGATQTPPEGYLTGVTANSYGSSDTLNNASGLNGLHSQIFYSNNFGLSQLLTFDATNNTLDVGNVAPTGWTQTDINTLFVTDDGTYAGVNPGHFGYSTASDDFIGSIQVTAVPEPSTFAALITGLSGILATEYIRRKQQRRSA